MKTKTPAKQLRKNWALLEKFLVYGCKALQEKSQTPGPYNTAEQKLFWDQSSVMLDIVSLMKDMENTPGGLPDLTPEEIEAAFKAPMQTPLFKNTSAQG